MKPLHLLLIGIGSLIAVIILVILGFSKRKENQEEVSDTAEKVVKPDDENQLSDDTFEQDYSGSEIKHSMSQHSSTKPTESDKLSATRSVFGDDPPMSQRSVSRAPTPAPPPKSALKKAGTPRKKSGGVRFAEQIAQYKTITPETSPQKKKTKTRIVPYMGDTEDDDDVVKLFQQELPETKMKEEEPIFEFDKDKTSHEDIKDDEEDEEPQLESTKAATEKVNKGLDTLYKKITTKNVPNQHIKQFAQLRDKLVQIIDRRRDEIKDLKAFLLVWPGISTSQTLSYDEMQDRLNRMQADITPKNKELHINALFEMYNYILRKKFDEMEKIGKIVIDPNKNENMQKEALSICLHKFWNLFWSHWLSLQSVKQKWPNIKPRFLGFARELCVSMIMHPETVRFIYKKQDNFPKLSKVNKKGKIGKLPSSPLEEADIKTDLYWDDFESCKNTMDKLSKFNQSLTERLALMQKLKLEQSEVNVKQKLLTVTELVGELNACWENTWSDVAANVRNRIKKDPNLQNSPIAKNKYNLVCGVGEALYPAIIICYDTVKSFFTKKYQAIMKILGLDAKFLKFMKDLMYPFTTQYPLALVHSDLDNLIDEIWKQIEQFIRNQIDTVPSNNYMNHILSEKKAIVKAIGPNPAVKYKLLRICINMLLVEPILSFYPRDYALLRGMKMNQKAKSGAHSVVNPKEYTSIRKIHSVIWPIFKRRNTHGVGEQKLQVTVDKNHYRPNRLKKLLSNLLYKKEIKSQQTHNLKLPYVDGKASAVETENDKKERYFLLCYGDFSDMPVELIGYPYNEIPEFKTVWEKAQKYLKKTVGVTSRPLNELKMNDRDMITEQNFKTLVQNHNNKVFNDKQKREKSENRFIKLAAGL